MFKLKRHWIAIINYIKSLVDFSLMLEFKRSFKISIIYMTMMSVIEFINRTGIHVIFPNIKTKFLFKKNCMPNIL